MNKLTILFIGATVLVIGITGTLLGYKYFERQQGDTQLEETQVQEDESPIIDETAVISEKPEIEDSPVLPEPEEVGETDNPLIAVLASISEEMVLNAGFKDPNLSIEQFDGLIFNDYDISEYQDDEHIRYILKEDIEEAGIINELIYPSEDIAQGVYGQLKTKMSEEDSPFEVNETNQYGKSSFFANNSEETNSVFLVVKFTNRLYTLHYPAKNHNKMKNLLESL